MLFQRQKQTFILQIIALRFVVFCCDSYQIYNKTYRNVSVDQICIYIYYKNVIILVVNFTKRPQMKNS